MNDDWQPIETAPKDGTIIQVRQGDYAPCHALWERGVYKVIEFNGTWRPTHWRPCGKD